MAYADIRPEALKTRENWENVRSLIMIRFANLQNLTVPIARLNFPEENRLLEV
jgi:hypothetical protein